MVLYKILSNLNKAHVWAFKRMKRRKKIDMRVSEDLVTVSSGGAVKGLMCESQLCKRNEIMTIPGPLPARSKSVTVRWTSDFGSNRNEEPVSQFLQD